MEKIIERIIEIERQANAIVKDARTKKEQLDEICKTSFNTIQQQKIEAQTIKLTERKAELEQQAEAEIKDALAAYDAQTKEYHEKFLKKSDEIAEGIFRKIITL